MTVGSRAWTVNSYASATQIDTFSTVSDSYYSPACTSCVHPQLTADNLGRVTRSTLLNDPQGATMVDAVYDSSGRIQSVSNPYRTTSDPTYGLETPSYDGMNRTTRITHADGNFAAGGPGKRRARYSGQEEPWGCPTHSHAVGE